MKLILALSLLSGAAAIGAPTDTARLDIEAMDRLDAEGKLDVVGRVLKFMDPTRSADPKEVLKRIGVAQTPERRLDGHIDDTYEPTTMTYAPTSQTYAPTTDTYSPTISGRIISQSIEVEGEDLTEADLVADQEKWKQVFADAAGPTVTPDQVAVSFEQVTTRRLDAEGRQLTVVIWIVIGKILVVLVDAEVVFAALVATTVADYQTLVDAIVNPDSETPITVDSETPPVIEQEEELPEDATLAPTADPTNAPTMVPTPLPTPVPVAM
jgi:hypothetical protein